MIHHVFANRSNTGDWLSALGIQRLLGSPPVVEHLCDEPFVAGTVEALGRCTAGDLIVIGGGGLLMDYFQPLWDGLADRALEAPVCLWGIGVVDLKAEPSLPRLDPVLRVAGAAGVVSVRDEATRRFLGDLPVPAPVPCPSLNVLTAPDAAGRGVLHVANYDTVGAAQYEVMRSTATRFAAATGRPYRETSNRIEAGSRDALEGCLRLYRDSDVVVTSALHGAVIAVAMGRRTIAVSGDRKIEGFMQPMGLGDWVVDHGAVDDLAGMLPSLEDQPAVGEAVEAARAANRAVAATVSALAQG